jgi:hypothetical protein
MKSSRSPFGWAEANQRHLMAALAQVSAMLENHRRRAEGQTTGLDSDPSLQTALQDAEQALPSPSALDTLCSAFRLSPFERSVLLLCAGVELDSAFAARCAAAQGSTRESDPTFGLALAALPGAHWSAITPGAPLRHWRLLQLADSRNLVSSPLRIDERVLHFLAGVNEMDDRLRSLVEPIAVPEELPPSQMAVVCHMAEVWVNARSKSAAPILQLCGGDEATLRAIAAMACRGIGLQLHAIRHSGIPSIAAERENLTRLWEREAVLSASALLLLADDADPTECLRTLLPFLERTQGFLIVCRREPLPGRLRPTVRLNVRAPGSLEQKALWRRSLGDVFDQLNGHLDDVVAQFRLRDDAILAVAAEMRTSIDNKPIGARLWDACRAQARPQLDDLAQRLEPSATREDLVLPENQRRILDEISIHVRRRAKVHDTWGFSAKDARGLGISALFAGPSGTGKTMAAEVLANELRLDLYRIDLSSVVSKYIGETEKNLRRVFDAADRGGAILLFDEADALFGKRSEVKDSHDRYANIEVSYLLQRMEAYRGLAILTTNLKEALDPAFLRRLRFVVQFPFPDATQRAEIWRRIFPAATPTVGVDPMKLSRLNVTGGNIRNVALGAAFLAADADEPVQMRHLHRAARNECAKIEKPVTESEIGGWI